jgi:hypothetical protein
MAKERRTDNISDLRRISAILEFGQKGWLMPVAAENRQMERTVRDGEKKGEEVGRAVGGNEDEPRRAWGTAEDRTLNSLTIIRFKYPWNIDEQNFRVELQDQDCK